MPPEVIMGDPGPPEWAVLRHHLVGFIAARVGAENAEDLAHSVLLRAFERLDHLRDSGKIEPWLRSIALSVIADWGRGKSRTGRMQSELGHAGQAILRQPDAQTDCPHNTLYGCLEPLLEGLSAAERDAVRLADIDGGRQAAVAEKLGISLSGVKSRIQRGRAHMRRMFEACCQIERDHAGRIQTLELAPGCCSPSIAGPTARKAKA